MSVILEAIDERGQEPTRDQWRAMVAELERQRNFYFDRANQMQQAVDLLRRQQESLSYNGPVLDDCGEV